MRRLLALVRTELAVRAGGPAGYVAFGFFVLAGMFAPFALGTDEALLERIAPGYLWLVAAIAVLVGLEGLFQDDIQQGRMDQLRLSGLPVWLIVLAMMGVYWLSVCLPLVIAAFPVAWLMTGDVATSWRVTAALLVGTPALAMLGTALAAIAAVIRRGTGLVIFLALPLFTPALIFGARMAEGGEGALTAGLFLAAFSLQSVALCPPLAGLAIRQNME